MSVGLTLTTHMTASNTTTAADYLAFLLTAGFTPAKWDRPTARQLDSNTAGQRVRVCYDVEEARFTVIKFDGQLVEWEASFTAGTPVAVVAATVAGI